MNELMIIPPKEKLLISFSGGKTSAYMSWYIFENYSDQFDEIIIVMANTGKERRETIEFAYNCQRLFKVPLILIEANVFHGHRKSTGFKLVNFYNYSRNGEPFEEVIKKYGLPNQSFPHCTRELKTNPIHAYIKSLGWKKYKTAIGIRADEMDRINPKEARKKNYWYPLAEDGLTIKNVEKFWANQEFTLNLRPYEGNCDFCWKKSIKKLKQIAKENPPLLEWWKEMESKYSNYTPIGRVGGEHKPPFYFNRGNKSIDDFLKQKKWDDSQNYLLDFGCKETCEPF